MIALFYFFAAILIFLSYKSFRGGIRYLAFFTDEMAKPLPKFSPFVSIIAPCRGLDDGLKENLRALTDQDYPDYEILFVMDDPADAAVPVIEEIAARGAPKTSLIVAKKAAGCSQKVENLREAVLHATVESQAFVFVDSDVRPTPDWLRYLVAPLANKDVGSTTGYRWFLSERPTFASELRSCWNASIASALGPSTKSNFCWGGSMAIRRDVFERLDIREKWRGTLSDDFAVTRAMNEAGLPIQFVPHAMTPCIEDCSLSEMLEFTTRQMKITRVYAPKLWLMSFFGSALFCGVMLAAFLITILDRQNGFTMFAAVATIAIVTALSTGKSWLRLRAVRLALPEYKLCLDRQDWTQNTLWIFTPAVFLFNSSVAWLSRRMTWRGIRYELKSSTETVIIAD